jgi:hypothetical protein
MSRSILLSLSLSLLATTTVAAEEAPDARAREAFATAREHFEAGRHAEALGALKTAHALRKLPLLLRYMGDCYAALGDRRAAVVHYRRYLKRAVEPTDRAAVEQKIFKLEEGRRRQRFAGRKIPAGLMPTGKDIENPLRSPAAVQVDDRRRSLTIAKWTALGAGVAGLALGITFNRLAASGAGELEEAMRSDCPPGQPSCGGNPDLDRPVVRYSLHHYELERQIARHNAVAVASFIVAGAAAAASVVLFLLDRDGPARVGVAGGPGGLSGKVTF